AMALVSSTPDVGTIRLWQYARRRIVPELRPYHEKAGSSNWTRAPGMLAYLRERLEKYPHEGIGEFHLFRVDPSDRALLTEVARMAKDRSIPIHIHSGAEPVRLLYELEASLTIIWAHAGMSEPPAVVEEMMARYATLYADTSYRERDILSGDDKISPDWRRLIERFPDRFMVGSDTWVNSQWQDYAELIALNRRWLSHFPRTIAEQIAFRNGERLFKRKVSRDLLGQR
ncbi:MAG: amidohydrolase family protein, partial [Hyphomicrobiaceae bacterium]